MSRVTSLRSLMKKNRLAGFIIPRQDEFQGEYVCPYAERLAWISSFSGSWGLAIVTVDEAALFVDGRYTVQAQQEVDQKTFSIHHLIDAPPASWIEKTLKKGDKLGFDPWLLTVDQAQRFELSCRKAGAQLVPVASNLIDQLWHDQPPRPQNQLELQPVKFAGQSAADKIANLRRELSHLGADATIITLPDVIAWIFNLRGSDVPFTPVVLAHAIVPVKGKAQLFIDKAKLTPDIHQALASLVTFKSPKELSAALEKLGSKRATITLDKAWTPEIIHRQLLEKGAKILNKPDLSLTPKARKNKTEQHGARLAHQRDGVAMVRFLCWLDQAAQNERLDEGGVAEKLHEFRQATGKLKDLSFETIPAAGPHAALPHYHVHQEKSATLKPDSIFLIDSGGQYQDGTTDITRTVIIGTPSAEMKDRFTRVLKGMIRLSRAKFPKGTTGAQLDVLARQDLWSQSLDYDHGTGHGVGSYLSVHEGPARINKSDRTPLEPGMILSNEPGYYKPGHYGIRIENLVLVQEVPVKPKGKNPEQRPMLSFETLTLCPIDRRLIDLELMQPDEITWLNDYHQRVLKELSSNLSDHERSWLEQACAPLSYHS